MTLRVGADVIRPRPRTGPAPAADLDGTLKGGPCAPIGPLSCWTARDPENGQSKADIADQKALRAALGAAERRDCRRRPRRPALVGAWPRRPGAGDAPPAGPPPSPL